MNNFAVNVASPSAHLFSSVDIANICDNHNVQLIDNITVIPFISSFTYFLLILYIITDVHLYVSSNVDYDFSQLLAQQLFNNFSGSKNSKKNL